MVLANVLFLSLSSTLDQVLIKKPNIHHFNWFQALGIFFQCILILLAYFDFLYGSVLVQISKFLPKPNLQICELADKNFKTRTIKADLR